MVAQGNIEFIRGGEQLQQLCLQDVIGIEAGVKSMGKTTEINAFLVNTITTFHEAIGLSILFVVDQGLSFHGGASARTFVF